MENKDISELTDALLYLTDAELCIRNISRANNPWVSRVIYDIRNITNTLRNIYLNDKSY